MSSLHFNTHKKEYLDNQGKELLSAILRHPQPPRQQHPMPEWTGYLAEKDFLDIGEISGPMDELQTDFNGKVIKKFRSFENEKAGYEFAGTEKIYLLVKSILKDTEIEEKISDKFLFDEIFEWLVTNYIATDIPIALSVHLAKRMNEAVSKHIIYLPILYLEADRIIPLDDVQLMYLKEPYIRELAKKVQEDKRENYIKSMLSHKGKLFAKTTVHAEDGKAIANAKFKVCFLIDIIRMLSPTVEEPRYPIYYDVDFRNTNRQGNQVLVQDPKNPESFSLNIDGNPVPLVIDQKLWNILLQTGLAECVAFIKRVQQKTSELDQLIVNGIKLFSKALANHDYHERIIYMYSVLESLLLPDESSPIIDSVAKYLPMLITVDIEQRKLVAATVKELYKVRSSVIHHGRKKDFDMDQLRLLQVFTRTLLHKLISLTPAITTKREVLKEIDDRLMSA